MKLAFFDAKPYDKESFRLANKNKHKITYIEDPLTISSIARAKGAKGVVAFVNCDGSKQVLEKLAKMGIKYWFERSAGYNNIDLLAATKLGIKIFRVPSYSPEAISEFAWTLLLSLNRNIHLAHIRTSIEKNFTLVGLEGETVHRKTIGVIGVGKIGLGFVRIAKGFGTSIIVYDKYAQKNFPNLASDYAFKFVDKNTLFKKSDFVSLHCILNEDTKHIVNKKTLSLMKSNALVINTARGELINTNDLLEALDKKQIRGAGIDVFEREKGVFFHDKSNELVPDIELIRLRAHRNVILTSHQAWFTTLAIKQIAKITIENIDNAKSGNFANMLAILPDGKIKNG